MKFAIFSLTIFIGCSVALAAPAKNAKPKRVGRAHVHGEATVDLAVDGKSASIAFNIDTQSLMGFEHAPKTKNEKDKAESVLQTFRTKIDEMFVFDEKANCRFSEKKLEIATESSHEDKGHGHHRELVADFDVACATNPSPGYVRIDLKKFFSAIGKIKVRTLSESGASTTELPGVGEVKI